MSTSLTLAVERALGVLQRRDEREFLPAALEVVETPASPSVRLFGALIILLAALAGAWAALGRVDIDAAAPGRVLPAGDVKVIQPADPGAIARIAVEDGQSVRRGQPLVELDPTQARADDAKAARDLSQAALEAARLSAVEAGLHGRPADLKAPAGADPAMVAQARASLHAQLAQQQARLSDLSQQIVQRQAEEAEAAAEAQKVRASVPMLEEKARINAELVAKGFGTAFGDLDARQALAEARNELTAAGRRIEAARAARTALERQREAAQASFDSEVLSDLAKAQAQRDGLAQEAVKTGDKAAHAVIRAPIDGVVEQLAVHTLGGVVSAGQRLMIVVPDSRRMTVEARLSNRDVGFVRAGQAVKLKVEAFSFSRYGLVRGHVIDVSRDAVDARTPAEAAPGALPATAGAAAPAAFVARIALDDDGLVVDGVRRRLQPGMTVTADIRTGSRSVAEYLFSPLARTAQESLHER